MNLCSINPNTEEVIHKFSYDSDQEIQKKLSNLNKYFQSHRKLTHAEKAVCLYKLADLLEQSSLNLAKCMAEEMGKPIAQGQQEIEKCARTCRYYAEHARQLLAQQTIQADYQRSYVCYEAMGLLLTIMPWNYPFWQVIRFFAPNFMLGNLLVLKHAPNVNACAKMLEKLIHEACGTQDVFSHLIIPVSKVEEIIADSKIRGVTLTGSARAGSAVGALAGKYLKKSVLELGGSDPYVIFRDADLEKAMTLCAQNRVFNSGQVCISAKRMIVHQDLYSDFISGLKSKMEAVKMGDPLDSQTQMGPLARKDLREQVQRQVQLSLDKGAKLILGERNLSENFLDKKGYFYDPTILTESSAGLNKSMPVLTEEVFGPVAVVLKAKDDAQAIQMANQSRYGLGAVLFSEDIERAQKIAELEIEAGNVFVNSMVKSDPRLPFGGVKDSGYGRELGPEGIKEFSNIKTVVVD